MILVMILIFIILKVNEIITKEFVFVTIVVVDVIKIISLIVVMVIIVEVWIVLDTYS